MVLLTTDSLELIELVFKYFCGLLLVSIVRMIWFKKTKQPNLKQQNKVSTFHFQPSLPRLPVPKLKDTCQQYLTVQETLLSPEQFQVTRSLTEEFLRKDSEGWKLNERLLQMDQQNKHTNYTAGFLKDKYLKNRLPLFYTNSFGVFDNHPENPNQIDRAAQIIYYATQFYKEMRDQTLPPYTFCLNGKKKNQRLFNLLKFIPQSLACYGAYLMQVIPLDMTMVRDLFTATRIPGEHKDTVVNVEGDVYHAVILRKCHFYSIQVIQPTDGTQIDFQTIISALKEIELDTRPPPTHPVTLFSSLGRTKWAHARKELLSIEGNSQLMELLDSALFILCLDDDEPENESEICRLFLHNYGYNRWFDKTVQFFVTKNSVGGLNFEHSPLTGGVALPLFEYIHEHALEEPHPLTPPTSEPTEKTNVRKIDFILSENLRNTLEKGKQETKDATSNFFFCNHKHTKLNKIYIKSKKMSPDGLIQVAFQVAYYRQYGCLPSLSEACRTSAFLHGRTETIRPTSHNVLNVARAMEKSSGVSDKEKLSLICKAVALHSNLIKNSVTGKGFDRHLFSLKCLAASEGLSLPFFKDPGFLKYSTVDIGSSTLPTHTAMTGGFGPFNPDSYALLYFIYDHTIDIYLTNHSTRDGEKYLTHISQVLDEIYDLFES